MTAVLFPVARNAQSALSAPLGRAARAGEAAALAHTAVAFVSEAVGPAFPTREAALDAFSGRVDDERPGRGSVAAEDRYCVLREVTATPPPARGRAKAAIPLQPVNRDGRRWPAPRPAPQTVWRLSISYWKVQAQAAAEPPPGPPPAQDAAGLRARLERPMRSLKPQQPLDIGLFEVRPPEAPHILMPDE